MSRIEAETQQRIADDALARIDQGILTNNPALLDQANTQIRTMTQGQRDLIEQDMVRQGLLPSASIQVFSNQDVFRSIDRDSNQRLNREEINNYLLEQSRQPAHRRDFTREMVLNQVTQRMGEREEIRPDRITQHANETLGVRAGYELALREYQGLATMMRQRYPAQFRAASNRFEISAAETALRDNAASQTPFMTNDQQRALQFMIAHQDNLYVTTAGMGTLFGLATTYFDAAELQRQAQKQGTTPDTVHQNEIDYRETVARLQGDINTRDYRVANGETISDIARTQLQAETGRRPSEDDVTRFVSRIVRANPRVPLYRLAAGQTIRIPSLAQE